MTVDTSPRPDAAQWYVLYTSPRAEKQVYERLVRQNITCWLPLHRSPRVWSDRIKMVEVPLFLSYIFVQCTEPTLRTLLHIYGVARIVYHEGRPAVIRQKEIDAVKEFLALAAEKQLTVGEEAEILNGAMKNISGKVQKIKGNHIVLYLEPLGITVSVKPHEVALKNRLR